MTKPASPPYTSVGDVDAFFARIENMSEPRPPKKVDTTWVKDYSFETAHPSAIPSMLRWLGIISDDSESTGVWNKLRVETSRREHLPDLVRDAYRGVFDAVDVEHATMADLRGAFVTAYSIGDSSRYIKCFLALCRHAGIKTAVEATTRESTSATNAKSKAEAKRVDGEAKAKGAPTTRSSTKTQASTQRRSVGAPAREAIGVVLNVEIPADWTDEQIRARIAAVTRAMDSL